MCIPGVIDKIRAADLKGELAKGVADPYEVLEMNAFFVIMASVCRDTDHD